MLDAHSNRLDFVKDFNFMPDSTDGPDQYLKHHDIDKKKESELYDMVTKIAADGVGPDGLDMYGCSQKNMRSPSLIWKAFGANDQKYHEDQWRPYTYSVIGVFGEAPRDFQFEGESPITLLPGDLLIFKATKCHRAVARPAPLPGAPVAHKYSKAFHIYFGAGLPKHDVNKRTFPCGDPLLSTDECTVRWDCSHRNSEGILEFSFWEGWVGFKLDEVNIGAKTLNFLFASQEKFSERRKFLSEG